MTQKNPKQASKKPNPSSGKKSFWQKRIPTLVGLGVLIIALVAGTVYFSQGTGVFAPRATPQTTPKKIKLTNVTDSSFTVSFLTDETTVGQVSYGTSPDKMKAQASDDRDQLSGTVSKFNMHHITVRGLEPQANYYFVLGTGAGKFDNNGQSFNVKTTQRTGVPSAAKTVYGSVVNPAGNPAEGAVVYLAIEGIGEMSSLVKSSGSWAIPLSNARLVDGSGYAQVTDDDVLSLLVQGTKANLTSEVTAQVANAQPVANITLGESQNLIGAQPTTPPSSGGEFEGKQTPEASGEAETQSNADAVLDQVFQDRNQPATGSGQQANLGNSSQNSVNGSLSELIAPELSEPIIASATAMVIDLEESETASSSPTVNTTQPKITGKAAPNVTVEIQINSETQITQQVTADEDGNFELDIAQLNQELEPGNHSATYSYFDPNTGQQVTKTQDFYVQDTSSQIAQADTSDLTDGNEATNSSPTSGNSATDNYPYSSASPYPIASDEAKATDSGRTTTPATDSAQPKSGSVGTTYTLILGGLFFILAGVWSWWIAGNLETQEI